MSHVPVTVIGGYLGAGKTTLLNHVLASTRGLRVAVLVNDFGSVNIDADLVRRYDGETISLANGCMCCSLVDGFAAAIAQVLERPGAFDHVIIEASGVADPAKIARYGQMYGLPIDGIIVMADAEQVRTQATNKYVGDTVVRQFAQADLLVLNKIDLVSSQERARVRAWLGQLAPSAPIVESRWAVVPVEILLGMHAGRLSQSRDVGRPADHPHAAYATWTVERAAPVERDAVARFAKGLGTSLYRAKGFVCLADAPDRRYVFQQVGTRWSLELDPSWSGTSHTVLVVIGRPDATSQAALDALLDGAAAPDRRLA
jgi:G3E family GTPase